MVVRASALYLPLLPFCTVGLLAVQCLPGGFKAYPIYPASQVLSNAAEDGLLDDLSHSAVLGAAGRQNSRLQSGIVIVGPSPKMWTVTNESKTIELGISRHYRAVPCGHESMSLVPRTLPPRANSTALSMSCRSFNLFDFYTPSKTVIEAWLAAEGKGLLDSDTISPGDAKL